MIQKILELDMKFLIQLSGTWVTITQLGLTFGNFKVYDVTTKTLNTFIGNGFFSRPSFKSIKINA